MKNLILCFYSFLIFQSCDSTTEPIGNDFLLKTLKGQILNYNLGDSVEVRLDRIYIIRPTGDSIIVISSGKINSDGSFNIVLSNPPDFLLQNYPGCFENILSDSSSLVDLHSAYILYKNNVKIGFMYCTEKAFDEDPFGGQYITSLLYSDRECTVTGDCINKGQTKTTIYRQNRHHYKGWNFIVHSLIENSDTLFITESSVNNTFQGNWFYKLSISNKFE